jgi:hypothetical protein
LVDDVAYAFGIGTGALAFSPSATHVAHASQSASVGLKVYKVVADALVEIFSDLACVADDKAAVAYSQDGAWMYVTNDSFPGTLRAYSVVGDVYTLVHANVLSGVSGVEIVYDAKFFQSSAKLAVSCQITNWNNRNFHVFDVQPDGTLVADAAFAAAYTPVSAQVYSFACAAMPLVAETLPPGVEELAPGSESVYGPGGAINVYPINGPAVAMDAGTTHVVHVKIYGDGLLRWEGDIGDELPHRLPSGYKAVKWEIEISGDVPLYSAVMATTAKELALVP